MVYICVIEGNICRKTLGFQFNMGVSCQLILVIRSHDIFKNGFPGLGGIWHGIRCVYLDIRFTNLIRVWEIKVDAFLQELVSCPMAYPLNLRPPTVDCR